MALVELAAGAALMALALLLLARKVRPRLWHRRFDVLALLLAVVALVEARKRSGGSVRIDHQRKLGSGVRPGQR